MKHKNIICSNSYDNNNDAQVWVGEIGNLQYVMINTHGNWYADTDVR